MARQMRRCNEKRQYGNCDLMQIEFSNMGFPPQIICNCFGNFGAAFSSLKLSDLGIGRSPSANFSHLSATYAGIRYGIMARQVIKQMQSDENLIQ